MYTVLLTDLCYLDMKYHYYYWHLNPLSTINTFIDPVPAPISPICHITQVFSNKIDWHADHIMSNNLLNQPIFQSLLPVL